MAEYYQKEELLSFLSPSSFKAYEWLKKNQQLFTGHIYGPVMLEIKYEKTLQNAIESIIGEDLFSFICEQRLDMNNLMRTVRDDMKLPINVCLAPDNCHHPVRENFPCTDQRSSILDKIEGPAPVLNYLCKYYYLHERALDDEEPAIPSEPTLMEVVASTSTQLCVLSEGQKDDDKGIQVKKETVSCNICGKQLSSRHSKSRHLNLVHGINAKGNPVLKPKKDKVSCVFCDKKYSNTFSLQRHIETTHLYDEIKTKLNATCDYKTPYKQNLPRHNVMHNNDNNKSVSEIPVIQMRKCLQCDAQFTLQRNLKRHKKKVHGEQNYKLRIDRKCPMCPFSSSMFRKTDMYKHFEEVHHLCMKWENHEFSSLDDFQKWKELIEKTTVTSYVRSRLYKNFLILQCNRCGTYKTKGKGFRNIKLKGSCKINSFCPSEIKVNMMGGSIQVKYLAQHVGHKNQIEFTRLSLQDRQSIALKLMNKVPKQEILNSIRSTAVNKQLQRIHLTNAADINNIAASLNLQDEWRKHRCDVVSTEAWVAELKESKNTSVLVYKAQGDVTEQFLEFDGNDFLLIYMTKVQKLVLEEHGKDTVCVDSTFGLNNYNFQLFTILTLDETREGFPVAFMFTNRSDKKVLERFYSEILDVTGPLSTNTFMSDMDETLYSAWVNVMGAAEKRLFCAWHVIRALKKNIKKKIPHKESQGMTTKVVTSLVYERDEAAFWRILQPFLSKIKNNNQTKAFHDYFEEYYLQNERYKLWAYCYRLHSGINTNMSLENFNKVLKYYYLHGRKVQRMDQALFSVVNLIRDKVYDLIIKKSKGKITTKLRILRKAHKRSLSIDGSHVIACGENSWEVLSTAQTEFYRVQKVKNCGTCQLQCSHCSTCFHEFSCSCFENAIKNNMCKHIHAVCKTIPLASDSAMGVNPNFDSIPAIQSVEGLKIDTIIEEITDSEDVTFEIEKNTLIAQFTAMISALKPKLHCKEQLDFLKKEMKKIDTVVEAIGTTKGNEMEKQSLPYTSGKIFQQRRYESTKKEPLVHKTIDNREQIVADLLLSSPQGM